MNPVQNKEGMLELLFEKFGVEKVQYGMQALMSLFAEGMMSAMLLDSGDGVTHCIPVFDGNVITTSFERMELAGRHVTDHLLKLLHRRGYAFNSTSDFELVRELKEKFCFISGDIAVDNKLALETCIH